MNRFAQLMSPSKKLTFEGFSLLSIGSLLLVLQHFKPMWLVNLALLTFLSSALLDFSAHFIKTLEKKESLFSDFTKTSFTLFFLILVWSGGITSKNLLLSLGAYASFMCLIQVFNIFRSLKNKTIYLLPQFLDTLVMLVFTIFAFLFSDISENTQMLMVALYFMILGTLRLYISRRSLSELAKNGFRGSWRLALPMGLSIYFPEKLQLLINHLFVGQASPLFDEKYLRSQWDKVKVRLYFPESPRP